MSEGTGDERLELSEEDKDALVSAALGRIETREDGDYLDGYKLPPDDIVLWDPRPVHITIYRYTDDGKDIEVDRKLPPTLLSLTNAFVRASNIRTIACSGFPLFIKPHEVGGSNPWN